MELLVNETAAFDFGSYFTVMAVISPPVFWLAVKWSKWNHRRYVISQMEKQFED